ncbi:unnamed protein product, partial [Prorocentrum cordatum]
IQPSVLCPLSFPPPPRRPPPPLRAAASFEPDWGDSGCSRMRIRFSASPAAGGGKKSMEHGMHDELPYDRYVCYLPANSKQGVDILDDSDPWVVHGKKVGWWDELPEIKEEWPATFVVPAESLGMSVTIFTVCALICLALLVARRCLL